MITPFLFLIELLFSDEHPIFSVHQHYYTTWMNSIVLAVFDTYDLIKIVYLYQNFYKLRLLGGGQIESRLVIFFN